MKVCIIAEGSYPYVIGGVSSWIHSLIGLFPDIEFSVLAIISGRDMSGKFKYQLRDNLTEVYEVYLNDEDIKINAGLTKKRVRFSRQEYEAFKSLIIRSNISNTDWEVIFRYFSHIISMNKLLMGNDFYDIIKESYKSMNSLSKFVDYLWTMRSIYLPLFTVLNGELPKADIYHCISTGYAGVLGSMAKALHGGGLIISEHGIYTREREEEVIKADWIKGVYKNIWIKNFRKMSNLAYSSANVVTCLFSGAKELQIDIGCNPDKIRVIPNGIGTEQYDCELSTLGIDISDIQRRTNGYINIGAVLRITPIKDVKTMLLAYAEAKKEVPNLKLWIMGPSDEDSDYAKECYELIERLDIKDIELTGTIKTYVYMRFMDMSILTSISEGLPLVILESFAARKPVIATDVGDCKGLVYGDFDGDTGQAGIITHVMNVTEIKQAIIDLALNPEKRKYMGDIGYHRVKTFYTSDIMYKGFRKVYSDTAKEVGIEWG